MPEYSVENLLILPGQGEESGTHLVIKVHATRLSNEFSVMQGVMKPRSLLMPHTHAHEDQVVVVLTGELEFEVGGEGGKRFTAPAGSYVIKPRGVQHAFWNATDEDVSYIELSGGAGFQGFVDASIEHGTVEAARQAVQDYDIDWAYERVPKMMVEHRLTSIAALTMPWDELVERSPKEIVATLRDKLCGAIG